MRIIERWALIAEADAAGVKRGQTATVRGTAYRVRDVEPNGAGSIRLTLDKS